MMETASEEGGKVSVTSIWNTLRDKRIVTPETISRSLQKLRNKQKHSQQATLRFPGSLWTGTLSMRFNFLYNKHATLLLNQFSI